MHPTSGITEDGIRPLAAREFEQIRRLAYETFGLDLKEGKQELVSARLRRLVRERGFQTYQELYKYTLDDRTGHALAAMIDALATNHTAFLREPDHFRFLKDQVAPELASRSRIDVWSAACSTGEEVWTLAFVLAEALPNHQIHVSASDISNKALGHARRGLYPAERAIGLPPLWYQRYLQRGTGEWKNWYKVAPQFLARADFRRLNLIETYSWPRPFPVIFCRNVMIYFDKVTQEKVVAQLSANLEPGGYLFVGHAESLTGVRHGLEYVRPAVYRKPGERVRH